ncbi:MAG: hypothetical protein M3458_07470 [Acidobacteriota bacterium]|nr:hypothetical protein [Acidobacteriota bacterium]
MSASYSINDAEPRNIVIDGADSSFVTLDTSHGEDTAYEQRVLGLLRRIAGYEAGRVILRAVHAMTEQRILILPTETVAESQAIRRGNVLAVRFSASAIDRHGNLVAGGPGISPDETLFHELVHSLRRARTWTTPTNYLDHTPLTDGFDNIEEFYAVLVTNIYSSESGRTLRRDHGYDRATNSTLPLLPSVEVAGMIIPDRRYADNFFPRHRDSIALMRLEGFGFGGQTFNQLANLPTDFNPLHQLVAFESQPSPASPGVRADRGTAPSPPPRAGAAHTAPRRGRQ